MRRSNIERQNSDILLSVIYKESICIVPVQKYASKVVSFLTKILNVKKMLLLKENIRFFYGKH